MTDSIEYLTPHELAELLDDADLGELDDNGSTLTLAPGYDLLVIIDQDPDANLDDYDESLTGRFVWQARDRGRPSTFDGAARIIDRDYGQACWWQPPDDIKGDRERIDSLLGWIRDRWDMGWSSVTLELLGPAPEPDPTDWRYQHSNYRAPRPNLGQAHLGGIDETEQRLPSAGTQRPAVRAKSLPAHPLTGTEAVTVHH